jgi:N-acetylglucosaminyl-diphospho-decaprenol L-rhamnosyltransferase
MQADKLQPAGAGSAAVPALQQAGQPGGDRASVDVVIVSADMAQMTLTCVTELVDERIASVIVVDNAFDEQAGSARDELARRAKIVKLDRRLGFAAANNRGIAAGSAPYVLLLNSDIRVQPRAIERLLGCLREDPGAVSAGGRLVDPQTLQTQHEYRPRAFPTLANFLVILLSIEERWPGNPITRRYHGAALDDTTVRAVAQPAAAALMVSRRELDAVGGLDERFWFWFEDSDLLLRLARRGRNLYVPTAVFRHLGGGTFRAWSKTERIRSVHHGILHYADAHFSRVRRAALGVVVLAISLPRVLLFARSRRDEASAWRAVAGAGLSLIAGRRVGAIAP